MRVRSSGRIVAVIVRPSLRRRQPRDVLDEVERDVAEADPIARRGPRSALRSACRPGTCRWPSRGRAPSTSSPSSVEVRVVARHRRLEDREALAIDLAADQRARDRADAADPRDRSARPSWAVAPCSWICSGMILIGLDSSSRHSSHSTPTSAGRWRAHRAHHPTILSPCIVRHMAAGTYSAWSAFGGLTTVDLTGRSWTSDDQPRAVIVLAQADRPGCR